MKTTDERALALLRQYANEVGTAVGYKGKPLNLHIIHDQFNPWRIESRPGDPGDMRCVPELFDNYSTNQIRAMVAHEYGHVMESAPPISDLDRLMELLGLAADKLKAYEDRADAFAARHGFGEDLISGLAKSEEMIAEQTKRYNGALGTSNDHPDFTHREANIRANMSHE